MNRQEIDVLKNQILNGTQITKGEAIVLAQTNEIEYLCNAANEIRIYFTGNYIDLCSITNARSGKCSENCKWCSQSAFHNTDIEIYDLIDKEQALIQARNNHKKGVHKFSLVTSGKTVSDSTLEKLLEIYSDIKKEMDIHLCASMGLLNKEQLNKLKNAGIVHYHCNLETASSFFNNLCTTHTIDEKLQTINWAKEVGLEICSGGIVGMGENMEQRIELALELRKIGAKSIPLNFLNPIKGTSLENANPLTDEEVMITIALFRFINPDANIRFAGGRNMISHLEEKALNSGINAALVGDLLTTVGKNIDEDMEQFKKLGFNTEKKK